MPLTALPSLLVGAAHVNRNHIRAGLWRALALPALSLCLFADCTALKKSGFLSPALAEITATLRDPSTQWMVFVCTGVYLLACVVLRRRLGGRTEAVEGGGVGEERGLMGEGGETRLVEG